MEFKYNKKIKQFIEILNDLIVNEEIRREILEKIYYFMNNGVLKYSKNSLTGRVYDDINKTCDYLEIKNDRNGLVCYYSDAYNDKTVYINQKGIKSGNTLIDRKEKQFYSSLNSDNYMSENTQEYIYDIFRNLVYSSNLEIEADYQTFRNDTIMYSDIDNNFKLEKNWYYNNGLSLRYSRYNDFFNTNQSTEKYVLFDKTIEVGDVKHSNGLELSEEEFKRILTGEISIDDVYKEVKPKIKSYLKDNDVIIFN